MKNRLVPTFIPIVVLLAGLCTVQAACSGSAMMPPTGLPTLHGVEFGRRLIAADSVAISRFGQIVSIVRIDSAMIVLTTADVNAIAMVSGVRVVCQSLGTTASAMVEVELGVGPAPLDSAVSIFSALGTIHIVDTTLQIVDGFMPANQLWRLDTIPLLTYAHPVVCPFRQV